MRSQLAECDTLLASVFEERAEHLTANEIDAWSVNSTNDQRVLKKLRGPGAKLLIGPRGCGKSMLLRRAYYQIARDGNALPAYVNYAKSLALEPLFHTHANALEMFRQWVLYKIVVGISEAFTDLAETPDPELARLASDGQDLVRTLERGHEPPHTTPALAPSQLVRQRYEVSGWRAVRRRLR